MAESEKKRRSGRDRAEGSEGAEPEKKKKKSQAAAEPQEQLRSPWGPLIWLLVPLFACLAYGLATRGH